MEGVEAVQAQAQQVVADHQQACTAFFANVDQLVSTASGLLDELSRQADEADRQKMRTAALKLRLNALARERRSREAEVAAIMEAKQQELRRLLQEEQALLQRQSGAAQGPAPLPSASASPPASRTT